MSKIFIFSGTSEGREISEFLSSRKIEHSVFVATEYGEIVMQPTPYAKIEAGRLTNNEMRDLFTKEKPILVVDATHPYAVEVTKNIKDAVGTDNSKTKYLRVQRELPETEKLLMEDYPDIKIVDSTESAIEYLNETTGNILLTTGVKTLKQYISNVTKSRLVARIIPSKESLDLAYESGVEPQQIIAMKGPFKTCVNEAFIEQYDIKILVTRNSGAKGGFIEKLEACKNKGIQALVIDNQKAAAGVSVEEAERVILSACEDHDDYAEESKINIAITGIGAGNDRTMTVEARKLIENADLMIGARRMVETAKKFNHRARTVKEYEAGKVTEEIKTARERNIVVLVSGDSGFYSGATAVYKELKINGFDPVLLPGISSISYLSSLVGEPYSEAVIISNHGMKTDVIEVLRKQNKLFSIVSGVDDTNSIISSVKREFPAATVYVGFDLGMEDEKADVFKAEKVPVYDKKGLYVIGVKVNE